MNYISLQSCYILIFIFSQSVKIVMFPTDRFQKNPNCSGIEKHSCLFHNFQCVAYMDVFIILLSQISFSIKPDRFIPIPFFPK